MLELFDNLNYVLRNSEVPFCEKCSDDANVLKIAEILLCATINFLVQILLDMLDEKLVKFLCHAVQHHSVLFCRANFDVIMSQKLRENSHKEIFWL